MNSGLLTLHVSIQPSQCPNGGPKDQQKCVNSRVKALKNIIYRLKCEFLENFIYYLFIHLKICKKAVPEQKQYDTSPSSLLGLSTNPPLS